MGRVDLGGLRYPRCLPFQNKTSHRSSAAQVASQAKSTGQPDEACEYFRSPSRTACDCSQAAQTSQLKCMADQPDQPCIADQPWPFKHFRNQLRLCNRSRAFASHFALARAIRPSLWRLVTAGVICHEPPDHIFSPLRYLRYLLFNVLSSLDHPGLSRRHSGTTEFAVAETRGKSVRSLPWKCPLAIPSVRDLKCCT